MTDQTRPAYVCVGGIIIDDIVFPNGQTRMGVLGGGGVHGAAGMWLWDQRPGLVAARGVDLPEEALRRLQRDFDLQGLIALDLPQARAWQVFEWDGRRTEIFRVDEREPFACGVTPITVPLAYAKARGLHLIADAAALAEWRARFPHAVVLWEPLPDLMMPEHAQEFRAGLGQCDIVSPNWLEAQHMYGLDDPAALVRAMIAEGAHVAVLRMGEAGSLIGQRGQDDLLAVPVVAVDPIVDQTGAGNTYCGGFLVGWEQTRDRRIAGAYGAVAASFALETTGVADPLPGWRALRDQRYQEIIGHLLRKI